MNLYDRNRINIAFGFLLDAGKVEQNHLVSITKNMQAVLDYLLNEIKPIYDGKIDTTHDQSSHKYRQIYDMLRHLSRKHPCAFAVAKETPEKPKFESNDELNQSATKSTTEKMMSLNINQDEDLFQGDVVKIHEDFESPI